MGRTSTSGRTGYRRGADHERAVASFLRERGGLVVRSPKSGSPMDLTVLWPPTVHTYRAQYPDQEIQEWSTTTRNEPWLVQCKLGGYMTPAEREELIELAKQYGCRPVMVGRKPFAFTDLTTGGQIEPPDPIRTAASAPREVPPGATESA